MSNKQRIEIIKAIYKAGSGHPGGSLSCIDIIKTLYDEVMNLKEMNYDVENPNWNERDRFVLSKGHASIAQYVVLAEKGFFDKVELEKFRKIDGILQGHPDMNKVPRY
jgi:transketolase